MIKSGRNSSHELLRVFAMLIIVWYHILSYYLYIWPHDTVNDCLIEAIIPSLHIGVILFILISGYYGIRPSAKVFFRLIIMTIVYFLPLQFWDLAMQGRITHPKAIIQTIMFLTNTPYWFVRTYLYLFMVSPLINSFIEHSSNRQLLYALLVMGIISVYFGTTNGDPTLYDGKNLINFVFLYLLGHTLKTQLQDLLKIKTGWLLLLYIILNASIIIVLCLYPRNSVIGSKAWLLSFPYCSPILIINAVIVFCIFTRLSLNSKLINGLAASMFAVYLIHCQPLLQRLYQGLICSRLVHTSLSGVLLVSFTFSVLILCVSVGIDKLFTPLWRMSNRFANNLQKSI